MIELVSERGLEELMPRICVIGVGGAGGNAVASMMESDVRGVEFVVANTDAQALRDSPADRIIQLGRRATEGLGAGSRAELGRLAAEESLGEIECLLDGAHMCFIAAGMGGGTGTGAAPVIAKAAKAKGILTVGVVTKPFAFEGSRRLKAAEQGLAELQQYVDTLIVIPNQNLFRIASPTTTFRDAFALADDVLQQGVRGITDLMVMPGLINLDFADVRTVMADMGRALMGTGEADGPNRAIAAAEAAMANPLLDEAIAGAKGLIISICGGEDMKLMEVDEAAGAIKALVDEEADIIWGSAFVPDLEGRIRVSVVATGIGAATSLAAAPTTLSDIVSAQPAKQPVEAAPAPKPAPAAKPAATVRPVAAAMPTQAPVQEPVAAAAPTQAPVMVAPRLAERLPEPAIRLTPPPAPLPGPVLEEELLLDNAKLVVLTPPAEAAALPEPELVEPFGEPVRGPSLFDRMAMAARAAVHVDTLETAMPAEALRPRRRLMFGGAAR